MHNAPRITECPHCNTAFRVTEAQLRAAKGAVRCGSCLEIFLANQHWLDDDDTCDDLELDEWGDDPGTLFAELEQLDRELESTLDDESWALKLLEDELQEDAQRNTTARNAESLTISEQPATRTDSENNPPELQLADEVRDSTADTSTLFTVVDDSEHRLDANNDNPVAIDSENHSDNDAIELPSLSVHSNSDRATHDSPELHDSDKFYETELDRADAEYRRTLTRTPRTAGARFFPDWLVALLVVTGLAGLGGQYIFYHLHELSQNAQWRRTTEQFCQIAGCSVPAWRDLRAINHDNLIVRSHPEQRNALLVNVSIINNSPFSQAFPLLELRFSDIDGTTIASRRFKPEEYLAGELSGLKQMPVNQAIQIELAIVDPGKTAVNYQMALIENMQK